MSWWSILGGILALVIVYQSVKAAIRGWQLRTLSSEQRRAVWLRIESYKLFTTIAVASKQDDVASWTLAKKTQNEFDKEYSSLLDSFSQEQRNQVHGAISRVWWTTQW
jgi:hypothetical protein